MQNITKIHGDEQGLVIHLLIPAEGGEAANLKHAAAALGTTPENLVQELYVYAMSYPPETFVAWYKLRQSSLQ